MTRITTWLAIGFFVISFALAYTAKERSDQADRLGIPQVSAGIDEAEDLSLDLEPSADDSSEEIPEI
jgi:preprotein translocase subunit SecG